MSRYFPNVVDTARIYRNRDFVGKFTDHRASICLTTRALAFEVSKENPRARFFADQAMIQFGGGPWFIQEFKSLFEAEKHKLHRNHLLLRISDVEAKDLFSYRNCAVELELNHPTRPNPIALQIVQKAELFAIADEVLERMLDQL